MISHRRVQKESDKLLYTVWSLVMVRNQLQAQAVKIYVRTMQFVERFGLSISRGIERFRKWLKLFSINSLDDGTRVTGQLKVHGNSREHAILCASDVCCSVPGMLREFANVHNARPIFVASRDRRTTSLAQKRARFLPVTVIIA